MRRRVSVRGRVERRERERGCTFESYTTARFRGVGGVAKVVGSLLYVAEITVSMNYLYIHLPILQNLDILVIFISCTDR